jgi:arsenical pump membrane protein
MPGRRWRLSKRRHLSGMTADSGLTLAIAGLAVAGVVVRPARLPEAVWAVLGALAIVLTGLLPWRAALDAAARGLDVYFFLVGMMLLSETARREGLFDWLAAEAVTHANGSPRRLFALVYAVGTAVTVFMSNDATAVVLTPAVFAVAREADLKPLPFLFACAFIANAASFVLPISNPANIVLFGAGMPQLVSWLARFALPSLVAVAATYVVLHSAMRSELTGRFTGAPRRHALPRGAGVAFAGIVLTAAGLMIASLLGTALGLPAALLGALTALAVTITERSSPAPILRNVAWNIVPLVAGLFVLVGAIERTGLIEEATQALRALAAQSPALAVAAAAGTAALASNVMNNLPIGLFAASVVAHAQPPLAVTDATLIAVDLGPNLSVTGSLATILWLIAIRRDGANVDFWRFLKIGALVMPPALMLAVAARLVL